MGLVGDKFGKYVVCPNCSSVYTFKDSYRQVGTQNVSKTCTFVRFPNHRQRRMRNPCGTKLLKEVTLSDGRAVARTLIGGGGVYSYIQVLPD